LSKLLLVFEKIVMASGVSSPNVETKALGVPTLGDERPEFLSLVRLG
jgi:hypothetical protein